MKEFFKTNAGMIIAVVAIAFVVWYFFLRKKKVESNFRYVERPTRRGPLAKLSSATRGAGTIGGGGVQASLSPCAKNPNGTWVNTPCCKMCNTSDASDIVM